MINYAPLWSTMQEKNVSTYALINTFGVCSITIYNLKHNKSITMNTLYRLCEILNCTPNEVVEFTFSLD